MADSGWKMADGGSRMSDGSYPPSAIRYPLYILGRVSYTNALNLQMELHARCVSGEIPGALVLVEHDPVITMGVRTRRENLLASAEALRERGIELVEIDRGGDVTYHGPGQLVGYPILRLRDLTPSPSPSFDKLRMRRGGDLHGYLRALEETIILTLADFGLAGYRNPPAGVWVDGRKVCSIGIAVRKWVSYHGFALNVDPDMSHFSLINPCGLDSSKMTSMARLLGAAPDMDDVRAAFLDRFVEVFGIKLDAVC